MSDVGTKKAILHIADELQAATAAAKCHPCGCFHGALTRLSEALPALSEPDQQYLRPALEAGRDQALAEKYECLGCDVCWPANALNRAADALPDIRIGADGRCPTDVPERERGWPPLPGAYDVLDSAGDIAVCVLTSEALREALTRTPPARVAIVGSLVTENLGIERLITNVLTNPNITTLVVCGADSKQRIGHLPGHTLLSLALHGVDERGRIVQAKGRRPILSNLSLETVETFRREIVVLDHVGEEQVTAVWDAIVSIPTRKGARSPLTRPAVGSDVEEAQPATRLVLDPHGYFILFPDRQHRTIRLEHYTNDGTLAHAYTGCRAQDLYMTVIARALVSRLDHAAYLGKELARAEHALMTDAPYVQDEAPEPPWATGCGCDSETRPKGV